MRRMTGLLVFMGLLAGGAFLASERSVEACVVRYLRQGGLCGCHQWDSGALACWGDGERCYTDGTCGGDGNPRQEL